MLEGWHADIKLVNLGLKSLLLLLHMGLCQGVMRHLGTKNGGFLALV